MYNTQFLLYPRPLTCQKGLLLFYMCQLWALHVVIKRQFFTFIFAVFLLNLFYRCILLHRPIYGVAVLQKRTEAILEYDLRFQFGDRRH